MKFQLKPNIEVVKKYSSPIRKYGNKIRLSYVYLNQIKNDIFMTILLNASGKIFQEQGNTNLIFRTVPRNLSFGDSNSYTWINKTNVFYFYTR